MPKATNMLSALALKYRKNDLAIFIQLNAAAQVICD